MGLNPGCIKEVELRRALDCDFAPSRPPLLPTAESGMSMNCSNHWASLYHGSSTGESRLTHIPPQWQGEVPCPGNGWRRECRHNCIEPGLGNVDFRINRAHPCFRLGSGMDSIQPVSQPHADTFRNRARPKSTRLGGSRGASAWLTQAEARRSLHLRVLPRTTGLLGIHRLDPGQRRRPGRHHRHNV